MKACFRCGQTKPLTEFYAHPRMADGHLNKCKICTRAYSHSHRLANLRETRAYDRARSPTRRDRGHWAEKARRDYVLHPERNAMRLKVARAVKAGLLVKPDRCQLCQIMPPTDGHHDDYSKPLEVRWLCRSCHSHIHSTAKG